MLFNEVVNNFKKAKLYIGDEIDSLTAVKIVLAGLSSDTKMGVFYEYK